MRRSGPKTWGPLVEGEVGCDQDGAAFVALAEDFEEQFGASGGQGHEAQFVDDEELEVGQLALEVQQSSPSSTDTCLPSPPPSMLGMQRSSHWERSSNVLGFVVDPLATIHADGNPTQSSPMAANAAVWAPT